MLPIYNELLTMWRDKGFVLPIEEGRFWLDNNFIQGITHDGDLIKLYKYKVFDDLHIEITKYSNKGNLSFTDFETWEETVVRNSNRLDDKINDSIKIIEKSLSNYSDYSKFILTSTGKDSMVALDLVHKIDPSIQVVFNNTSLDCSDTYKMVKQHPDWIVTNPKQGFYQWIKEQNFIPTRFSRGCCSIFKEGNMIEHFSNVTDKAIWFMGLRNDESTKRADREDITHNPKWGNRNWYGCLPIRKWSDFDIWLYIIKNNIDINPKYKKGYSRCGCAIACPYATKYTWVLDEYWYPEMRKRWIDTLDKDFIEGMRWTKMNCTKEEYHLCWNGGLYRDNPTDQVVSEFMKYKGLTDKNVALQYFNKTCCICGKNVRQNDVLAMNLKLLGRNTNKIFCRKHLMEELKINKEEWEISVSDFKRQGCTLF